MTITCPYCNNEMKKGYIYTSGYNLKWVSEDKDLGALLQLFPKGIKLTSIDMPNIETWYCPQCEKMIIDVKNQVNNINENK